MDADFTQGRVKVFNKDNWLVIKMGLSISAVRKIINSWKSSLCVFYKEGWGVGGAGRELDCYAGVGNIKYHNSIGDFQVVERVYCVNCEQRGS